jgi:hypothetical protein
VYKGVYFDSAFKRDVLEEIKVAIATIIKYKYSNFHGRRGITNSY